MSLPISSKILIYPRNAITISRHRFLGSTNFSGWSITSQRIRSAHLDTSVGKAQSSCTVGTSVSGVEDALMGYMFGKKKATEVAHSVWKHVIRKGDVVIDATCGNGNDTLAMLKLVKDESGRGRVYAFDMQEDAIKSTSSLIEASSDSIELGVEALHKPSLRRNAVVLIPTCHSRMLEELPKDCRVRLIAFNLGYLPGGDKTLITKPGTTLLALEAAKDILTSGGLISLVVYLGHPGGREEFETVKGFASSLPVEDWACTQIQMLNKPSAPVLMLLFKR